MAQRGLKATVEQVSYEVQRGGNQMLRVARSQAYNASDERGDAIVSFSLSDGPV